MASESLTTFGTTKMDGDFQINPAKIFKWGDAYIGHVGSVAMEMIIRDLIKKKKKTPDLSSPEEIYQYFNKLHKKLKEKYHLIPNEDDDDPVESSQYEIVIANPHGIFAVHSLREVDHLSKFWAYGSGRRYALGAMNAVYNLKKFDAVQIATAGVQAGITFDNASGGKIHVVKVKMA